MAKIKVKVIQPFSDGVNGYKVGQEIMIEDRKFSSDRMIKLEAEKLAKVEKTEEKKATKKKG